MNNTIPLANPQHSQDQYPHIDLPTATEPHPHTTYNTRDPHETPNADQQTRARVSSFTARKPASLIFLPVWRWRNKQRTA